MDHQNPNQNEAAWNTSRCNPATRPNANASPLLQLPSELRLQIYLAVFAGLPDGLHWHGMKIEPLALMQTCHIMRREVSAEFLKWVRVRKEELRREKLRLQALDYDDDFVGAIRLSDIQYERTVSFQSFATGCIVG